MYKRIFYSIFFLGMFLIGSVRCTFAQKSDASSFTEFRETEHQILQINKIPLWPANMQPPIADSIKILISDSIVNLLKDALTQPASWQYPFDSLRLTTIAIATYPKSPVRVFSFNTILNTGQFIHHAIVQLKTKKGVQIWNLTDTSQSLPKNWQDEGLTENEWIGALYYQMFPFKFNKQDIFVLMGFDGHNKESNRSILETLYFEDGELKFGFPLFRESEEDPSPEPRSIWEYHKSAQMVLRYQTDGNVIVCDQFAPAYEQVRNDRRYYIPSGDYEGYFRSGKTWVKKPLTADMPFAPDMNIPDPNDRKNERPIGEKFPKNRPEKINPSDSSDSE